MKNKLIILLIVLQSFSLFSQGATDTFEGQWKTEKGSIVSVSKSGTTFSGILIDGEKLVLKDLHFEDGVWECLLIRPKDGVEVNATAKLENDKIVFIARKYFTTKTITWTKITK